VLDRKTVEEWATTRKRESTMAAVGCDPDLLCEEWLAMHDELERIEAAAREWKVLNAGECRELLRRIADGEV
jgi:hypothetical protein